MSFKEIESALSDAEAVQNYKQVKSMLAAVETAYQQYREAAASREQSYINKISDLEEKLEHSENLTIRYNKTSYTPKAFAKLVSDQVEKEYRASINREVNERWAAEAPNLVREATKKEILSYPKSCEPETRTAIESQGSKHADTILRNRYTWPQWFQNFYQNEVNLGVQNGLNKAFWDNVNQKATEEINRRANIAWPLFVQQHITPKFQGSLRSQLTKLSETMKIRCDKCGTEYDYTPTPEEIAALIREPRILYRCLNPACRDFIFPHNFPVSLGSIIYNLTTKNAP